MEWQFGNLLIVFSTYVEVILRLMHGTLIRVRILHVCGGDPKAMANLKPDEKYSPRMWR